MNSSRQSRFWPTLLMLGLCAMLFASAPGYVFAEAKQDPHIMTFWPLIDSRSLADESYLSIHFLGPLIKYERNPVETKYAFRPFFHQVSEPEYEMSETDVLWPLLRFRSSGAAHSASLLKLWSYEWHSETEDAEKDVSLFPLAYYRDEPEQKSTFALFPIAGTMYDRFNRDEIHFVLFPIYSRTYKQGTRVDNYLWPFFARISGEDETESGFKIWPLYGHSSRDGVYNRTMMLWPLWFSYDDRLDTDIPEKKRYSFPLYLYKESPVESRRTFLWPFFSYYDDRLRNYKEWNMPWPLIQRAVGEYRHGWKVLPFSSDITQGNRRDRWYFWPLFKIEEQDLALTKRRRDRFLFFVFTDISVRTKATEELVSRRTYLWPLFGYRNQGGVSHFHLFAPLEPIWPESRGLERNWAPFWRLYQLKWDRHGNRVTSILWNLYWSERQTDSVMWELFPFVKYHGQSGRAREWSVLKGLVRYRNKDDGKKLHLLYLPWGIPI